MGRTIAGAVLQVFGKVNFVDVDDIRYVNDVCKAPSNMPTKEQLVDLINNGIHQIVLTGAPGTGKTYTAREVVKEFVFAPTELTELNQVTDEKEKEAEIAEKNEEYKSDRLMMRKIKGKEYLFKESIWKMIDYEAKQKLEEKIESLENCLAEEEYLRLLINYREWGKE